jgi:predicted HD superfamily hydrolase involved in NAD metabolism
MGNSQLVERFRAEAEQLPDWLRSHVERVVVEGRRLALRYALAEDELNLERVEAACWGHDLYRAHEPMELLALADELRLPISPVQRAVPILLHGPVAAARAERDWGIDDEAVLEAIRWHTTARPGMSAVATTVFLADKIEPSKVAADPGLAPIRALADHNPEAALLAFLERRLQGQIAAGQVIDPASLETRNTLLGTIHDDGPTTA